MKFLDGRARRCFVGGAGQFQEIGAACELERERHVLLNQQASQPLGIELADGVGARRIPVVIRYDRLP